jgi:TRAP-type transport system small permease protein
MKNLVKIYKWVNLILEKLVLALLVVMTLVTMYRVTMRFFFNFTPSWTEEFTSILVVWIMLIGLAIGVRERMHLKITMFYDMFPKIVQKVTDILLNLMEMLLGVFFVLEGLSLTITQSRNTMSVVKIMPWSETLMPNSILYIFVPIAGLLIIFYSIINLLHKEEEFRMTSLDTEEIA